MKGISRKTLALLHDRERAAVQLANRAAEEAGRRIADYRKPKVHFYSTSTNGAWSVYYVSRFPSRTTDCFHVVVDAATHATKIVPCS
jgi:hypothetical protein